MEISVDTAKRIVIIKPKTVYEPKNAGTVESIAVTSPTAESAKLYVRFVFLKSETASSANIATVKSPQRKGPISP